MLFRSEELHYRQEQWYSERAVEPLTGTCVVALDVGERRVSLSDGGTLAYDSLLIATGARPRRLEALERYGNVSVLRTTGDALRLREALRPGAAIAIVGAGFVGQEVAATARRLGAQVTIVEAQAAPLAGELGAQAGGWFSDLHRSEGVRVLLGTTIADVRGRGKEVAELRLAGGERVECDHVLIGIGADPSLEFVAGTGLDLRGLSIDATGWTGVPGVYAAGDVAAPYEPALGRRRRTQHWEAAARQGAAAALSMLGLPARAPAPASFWSDQYGVRIHYLGYASEADELTLAGEPTDRRFLAVFRRERQVVAALLVGMAERLREARSEVEAGLRSLQRMRGAPCPM